MWRPDRARDGLLYRACYCEENIWYLAQDARLEKDPRYVVVVSNPERSVPVYSQRSAPSPVEPVLWDYHVILLLQREATRATVVYDLDSELELGCPFEHYADRSFPRDSAIVLRLPPRFRILTAEEYIAKLSSDRSHMRVAGGGWSAPPPEWPLIQQAEASTNLQELIDMRRSFLGEVLDLDAFIARFKSG